MMTSTTADGLVGVDQDDAGLAAGDGAAARRTRTATPPGRTPCWPCRGRGRPDRVPTGRRRARAPGCRRRRPGWPAVGCRRPRSAPVRRARGSWTGRTPCPAASRGPAGPRRAARRRRPSWPGWPGTIAAVTRTPEVGPGARLGAQQDGRADRLDGRGALGRPPASAAAGASRARVSTTTDGEPDEQRRGAPEKGEPAGWTASRRPPATAASPTRVLPSRSAGEVELHVLLGERRVVGQRLRRRGGPRSGHPLESHLPRPNITPTRLDRRGRDGIGSRRRPRRRRR